MRDLETNAENTWCPGCGNFGILSAVKNAITHLDEEGISSDSIVISAGIGCHAKIFDYLGLSGLYSLHGRDIATVQGMKIANPDLKVINFSGDGNGMGEGLAHTLFAAKRNQDMTMILHNNSVYALTTGQFTPLTQKGWEGPSTPRGSFEEPFNPLVMMIVSGATFVARSFSGKMQHLTDTIISAVKHKGFSFVEVLQPAVPYHSWSEYRDKIKFIEEEPSNYNEALKTAQDADPYTLGIFYRNTEKPVYHEELYGDHNPVNKRVGVEERRQKIIKILK
ncbi:MAG: 2-oxoacid:ferredoxin oxidoreductase subunit beta [Candidatus Lokiarchaeota archaeon]|nr:2-oxoacid:ferredoxin oxidoreductase subunit beta [Candidatus Lokiarchaeota archaeon]MBD3202617.1 2-oxoacid:ferredoxin oxidoreductase subunit beta [Candidatus Lokiarchaeota archaeon]